MKKELFQLFYSFFRIGAFTFGGGWAMLSLIEKEVVTTKKWIEKDEFLDLLAIAQSMPGVLAVNISVIVGDKVCGKRGSFFAAMGTILPCFFIILGIAMFLTPETIKNNEIINRIFMGIRPAVVALIIAPVITSAKSAKINHKTVIIPIAVAVLIFSNIPILSNPILYIILGGIVGVIVYKRKNKRYITENIEEKK